MELHPLEQHLARPEQSESDEHSMTALVSAGQPNGFLNVNRAAKIGQPKFPPESE